MPPRQIFNIYCDESCHLEHDGQPVMLIGGILCPKSEIENISKEIRSIKERHKARGEIKWVKVSNSRINFFKELVAYFFKNKNLRFRCLIVDDKTKLNHSYFNQGSHDTFYYKMYFYMLENIIKTENQYNIYLDIKDTKSIQKVRKLGEILCNNVKNFDGTLISTMNQIRSNESEILQLADLLIGAINYEYRTEKSSQAKTIIMNIVKTHLHHNFKSSTPPWEEKFNIFVFSPKEIR